MSEGGESPDAVMFGARVSSITQHARGDQPARSRDSGYTGVRTVRNGAKRCETVLEKLSRCRRGRQLHSCRALWALTMRM